MGRNHLAHATGDAINAILAALGYNFKLPLRWLVLWCACIRALLAAAPDRPSRPQLA